MSGNGTGPERVTYEAPSAAIGARMLAILHTELPAVYAWCLGYAAAGVPPSTPRNARKRRAPDLVGGLGDVEQRSTVGGR